MIGGKLLKRCMDSQPRLNPDLCEGLAFKQSDRIERYVDEVLHCASASFPPGLRYCGYRPATPEEQLRELTRLKRGKRQHEIAYSDLYHCMYEFEFEGQKLKPRFLQLPYIRRGGLVRVRGSSFVVSPVLADNIFSIEPDRIYMPVTRSKLTFQRVPVRFQADGESVSVDTVYSSIFNIKGKGKGDAVRNRHSLLIHYILCKFGLTEGLQRYFDAEVRVGYDEINVETYSPEEWVICKSRGIRPNAKGYVQYTPSELRIALPRDKWTADIAPAIGGIFYIIDHEPDMVEPSQVDNPMLWRRLLPRFIKAEVSSERKAMEEMEAHIDSVDSYLDDLVRRKLTHEGVPCRDIYDVFAHIIKTFTERTMHCDPADIHNKQLETVRFLMYDVVFSISILLFELVKLTGDRLKLENIERTFDQLFKTNVIQHINGHGEVTTLESATDCLPFSVTKTIVPQAKASNNRMGRPKKSAEMSSPTFALHASQCTVNTYLFITKSAPSARESINHFLQLDPHDGVVVDPKFRRELEHLQEMISMR